VSERVTRFWPALDVIRRGSDAGDRRDLEESLLLLLDDEPVTAVETTSDGRGWRVYFEAPAHRDAAAEHLGRALGDTCDVAAVDVEDEGWALKVQQDLRAVRVGRIVVAPPWDVPRDLHPELRVPSPEVLIVIEPSTGFGTGHHQSTRLCLRALQAVPLAGARVLDVGTGSGVLAIAASRLGAREVHAFDHDADSVTAARENARRNHLSHALRVELADLSDVQIAAADVVLANLTAAIIRRHAGTLVPLVRPGGCMITGGFTIDQTAFVRDVLRGLAEEKSFEEDGWAALVLRRPNPAPDQTSSAAFSHA
jgi:ribosomal protein L11 methyltransferase